MRNTFTFPNLNSLSELQGVSIDKIVIISVVGKRPYLSAGPKIKSLGRILVSDEFSEDEEFVINGAYDEENQIINLHLCSLLDSDFLIKYYKEITEKVETKLCADDFLAVHDEIKSSFARALFFLFYASHIVVFYHPGYTLDTNYIQYFKAVDSLGQKISNHVIEGLRPLENISREWMNSGRFCTPRVIFYFEKCPKNVKNVKKLEHNLEDKIYNILKKTRIISTSGNSLFTIPLNDEFVYVSEDGTTDILGDAIRDLIADCQPGGGLILEAPYSNQVTSEKNFKKFIQVHIQQARDKGFDDVMTGRNHHLSSTHFELPVLKQWIEAAKVVYNLSIKKKRVVSLCTDTRFSEQRCLKVLPLALARYQEGLSSHYGRVEHEARLNMALTFFRAQARGPVYLQYAKQLETDCLAHWKNGKEQCEFASLTGNPCKLPKHSDDQEHMSGFIYKSICDCGRKIGPREDPYNAKQANYFFYQQISQECKCSELERFTFTTNETIEDKEKDTGKQKQETIDQESCLEMLTLSSPPGILPNYPSWSLVCLGASSLYSHNLGLSELQHPGFLSSTNYLLPWDVTVYSKSKQNWPHVTKYAVRGRRGRPVGTSPQLTVKVFIGVEYECSSGHRFMLSAPDRMLKATPGSIVKDTGHKIAESDMPLYFPCACRGGKLAQLMRLHVVTPKAPVYCTLDPKVQTATGSHVFICTANGPIKLTQSAYWIMRLPYVYIAEREAQVQNPTARLLQGVFSVNEVEQ